MATRRPSMTEQKLVTLCALDRLGPVTALQLLRFMVENELMDYIELQLSIAELDEMGLLRKLPHQLGVLYAPSIQGYETLRLFQKRIPNSRAGRIDELAPRWKRRFREEKQVLADWEATPTGEYRVRLRLMESELALLDLTLSLPTREQAIGFCARWPSSAGAVYAGLMDALGEAQDPPEGEQRVP